MSKDDLQKLVTEALISMVSTVTGMSPPANEPPPPFIQAGIDRAVSRLSAHIDPLKVEIGRLKGEIVEYDDMLGEEALKRLAAEARTADLEQALEGMVEYFPEGHSDGECFSVAAAKAALAQSAPPTNGEGVSRVITLSGCKFTEHELIERAVRAATGTSRRGTQRWIAMKDAFGCGSGVANALCHRFDFDPDEMVKP